MCVRRLTSFVALTLLVGCGNPTASSVSKPASIAKDWAHLETEEWTYSLEHPTRVADYHFFPHGTVTISYGTKSGDTVSVVPSASNWSVDAGTLSIGMGGVDGRDTQFLRIVELSDASATIHDVESNEELEFSRTYHPQSDG